MAKNFRALAEPINADPARRSRVDAHRKILDAEIALYELRKEHGVTQVDLAAALEVSQGNISTLENRDDALISTLRDYLAGLGAELRLTAVFNDHEIPVRLGR
jgi:DNA-binding XRE family transcriptional regulator